MLKLLLTKFISACFLKRSGKGVFPIADTCQIPKLFIIYEQYFGKDKVGTFVEIGAFDGEHASNTSGLADIGWNGIYVEPVPDFFIKCKKRHSKNTNVKIINVAVGASEGILPIYIGGPLSTAHSAMKDNFINLKWAKSNFRGDSVCISTLTTLNILLKQEKMNTGFEVLVIDVEGYELDVLKGFDIDYWRPQMVIIELHDQNDSYLPIREQCKKIVEYFEIANYKVIWKDFTNTIYVPKGIFPRFAEGEHA